MASLKALKKDAELIMSRMPKVVSPKTDPSAMQDILSKADAALSSHGRGRKVSKIADILRKSQGDAPEIADAPYAIKKVFNDDEQIVLGQVYAPDTLDSHGHYMSAAELRMTAHQFMMDGLLTSIDVQHDNNPVDAVIVESFIARKGDPDFEEGAWVAATKIKDPMLWRMVKNGEINGYSFEIMTYRRDLEVDIEYSSWYYGFTDPDPHDKHDHPFMVRLDDNGEIIWGQTGPGSDGSPAHTISKSNITEAVSGHLHRIHLKD